MHPLRQSEPRVMATATTRRLFHRHRRGDERIADAARFRPASTSTSSCCCCCCSSSSSSFSFSFSSSSSSSSSFSSRVHFYSASTLHFSSVSQFSMLRSTLFHHRRGFSSVTAQELRSALRLLALSDNCTDAEVKAAFRAFVKANHPDTIPFAASNSKRVDETVSFTSSVDQPSREQNNNNNIDKKNNNIENDEKKRLWKSDPPVAAAAARTAAATEAYQLLKKLSAEERRMILLQHRGDQTGQERRHFYTFDDFQPGGAGRNGFSFTEEEFAKAQAAYEGRPRNPRRGVHIHPRSGGNENVNASAFAEKEDAEFFNPRTAAGRKRTADFNKINSRIEQLRRRAGRHAAPWKVADGDGTYPGHHHPHPHPHRHPQQTNRASYRHGKDFLRADSQGRRQHLFRSFCESFSYGPGFSLRFYLTQIREDLQQLRHQYEKDKTFAGIRSGRHDSSAQEANKKRREELKHHPQPHRHYLLLKLRAQERAAVDQAVNRLLSLALFVFSTVMVLLVVVAMTRKRRAASAYERIKAEREAAGGG